MKTNLTEEQMTEIRALVQQANQISKKYNRIYWFRVLIGITLVHIINQGFVQNDWFVISMTAATVVLVVLNNSANHKAELEPLREKYKEIVGNSDYI